jgi:hypothetical protein
VTAERGVMWRLYAGGLLYLDCCVASVRACVRACVRVRACVGPGLCRVRGLCAWGGD